MIGQPFEPSRHDQATRLGQIPRGVQDRFMGEAARRYAMKTAKKLRDLGLAVDIDHLGRSFKSQFKYADKTNARFTAVIGDNEVADEAVTLRNMRTGDQTEIDLKDLGAVKALVKEEK